MARDGLLAAPPPVGAPPRERWQGARGSLTSQFRTLPPRVHRHRQRDVAARRLRMIQRRTSDASIKTRIGNHIFRATGITAYLKNKGTLEAAQHIANHESPWTTKLYDRRQDKISLDEVENISI